MCDFSPDLDPNEPLDTLVVHRVRTPIIKESDVYVRFVFTSRDVPEDR